MGVPPGVEAPSTPADKKAEITKRVIHKTALQKSVLERTASQKAGAEKDTEKKPAVKKTTAPTSAPKKTAAPMPATKKPVARKETASVSAKKIPENKSKRQAGSKTLKTDVQELTRDMRSLEEKLEKMIKTFDSIAELNVAGSKSVKK